MSYSTLEHALAYHDAGFNVIPCEGKKPSLPTWKDLQRNPADRDRVARYFATHPQANVGFITGEMSGVTVLDFDVKKIPEEKRAAVKAAFLKEFRSPLIVATGGGGFHVYYQYEPDAKNAVSIPHQVYPLDIRTEGGFVVAPPSIHPDTHAAYSWHGVDDFDINMIGSIKEMLPPLPDSIRAALSYQRRGKLPEDWYNIVNSTREGSRNYNAAAILGKLMGAFPPQEWQELVIPLVRGWNMAFVKPPMDERELMSVFKSIAKTELQRRESGKMRENQPQYGDSSQPA